MQPTQLTLDNFVKRPPISPIKTVKVVVDREKIQLFADDRLMVTTEPEPGIEISYHITEIEEIFIYDLASKGIIDERLNDETQWRRVLPTEMS